MSLSFKYIPLTFLKDVNQIKKQIKNTVILRYLFDQHNDSTSLESLITGTQYGYNASALQSGKNKFLRISDITDGKVDWSTVPFCDCSDEKTYLLDKNDLLIARTGGTTGKSFLISNPPKKAIFAGYLIRIRANKDNSSDFLNLFLNSYVYWSQVVSLNKGEFRPSVNASKLKNLIVPNINVEVQKDAVDISNGISVQGYSELENAIESALKDFDKSQVLIEHCLIQNKNTELLKEAIIKEAIQGKLTANWRVQNPNTEPANGLLKRIKEEKAQLIKDKKIKKEKPLPPITEEEIPFILPENWVWCRIADYVSVVRGGSPRPAGDPRYYDGDIPFLKVGDLTGSNDVYLHTHTHTIKEAGLNKTRMTPANTVMLSNSGATLGEPRICAFEATFNDGIAAFIHLPDDIYKEYLFWFLKSKTKWFLETASRGQGQPNLNTDIIRGTLFPLPSNEEQKAIVEKVETLLQKCQALEQEIKTSEANAQMLMQAVLKEAFEGKQEVCV